jgi:hypothetical protein
MLACTQVLHVGKWGGGVDAGTLLVRGTDRLREILMHRFPVMENWLTRRRASGECPFTRLWHGFRLTRAAPLVECAVVRVESGCSSSAPLFGLNPGRVPGWRLGGGVAGWRGGGGPAAEGPR